jgi:hypothetical protein
MSGSFTTLSLQVVQRFSKAMIDADLARCSFAMQFQSHTCSQLYSDWRASILK